MSLENSENIFESQIINDVENPKEVLANLAKKYGMNARDLGFEVRKVYTFKKGLYDTTYERIPQDKVDEFLTNEQFLLEPSLMIKQHYDLFVDVKPVVELPLFMRADKFFTKLLVVFKKGLVWNPNDEEQLKTFFTHIRRLRAWHKIIIADEENRRKRLREFLEKQKYPLENDLEYQLDSAINLTPSKEEALTFVKDLNAGFVSAQAGELIGVYQKPVQGKPGRNLQGIYIVPQPPTSMTASKKPTVDKTIKEKEDDDKIEYFAIRSGIIKYESGILSIQTELEISEISQKESGDLISDLNSGTNVHLTQKDFLKDAIGDGMKVRASEVKVDGNIGANATVEANELEVGGQTHSTSMLMAKNAKVNIHKGTLRANNVRVKSLESGTIIAQQAIIEKAVGGKIYAQVIKVGVLHSNSELHASERIEVNEMISGENKFFISANSSLENRDKFNELLDKKESSIKNIAQLTKTLKEETKQIGDMEEAAKNIRKILVEHQQNHTQPPAYLLEQFRKYRNLIKHLKGLESQIKDLEQLHENSCSELERLELPSKKAIISIQSGWVGYNEVRYDFFMPEKHYFATPKSTNEGSVYFDASKEEIVLK